MRCDAGRPGADHGRPAGELRGAADDRGGEAGARAGDDDQLAVEALAQPSGDLACSRLVAEAVGILAGDAARHVLHGVQRIRHEAEIE